MKNKISIHRYTMRSRGSLNAMSVRREHPGALIRLESDAGSGYGCLHPWPELGDEGLEQILVLLETGQCTALSRRALQCARADAAARRDGVSLFDGLVVPRSHATLTMDEGDFQSAVEAGFTTVKVKVGRDFPSEVGFIREQAGRFPKLEWRLDFNGGLDTDAVKSFLAGLGDEVRDKIDFLEDAYLPGITPWVDALGPYDIPMAVDREVEHVCGGFGVAVVKPALHEVGPILDRVVNDHKRVVITSYMDHPVGQCFAAWEAAMALRSFSDVVDTCGLVTHGLFEPNEFTEELGKPEPDFHPPAGTGLGFDALLESLPWKSLT